MKPKDKNIRSELTGRDLSKLLDEWTYEGSEAIRRIRADDGREILQVRLPLGIEQYELNGRPDGARPRQQESWLHFYRKRAKLFAHEFVLDEKAVERLSHEGLLYYYRYLRFFQIKEYRLCERDTKRNLELLEFVTRHGTSGQAEELEQYRPYILRMNFMARALGRIQYEDDLEGAIELLDEGLERIQSLADIDGNQVFEFEKVRSLKSLADLKSQLVEHVPVPKHVELEREMERAVADEDYERAALLRDELRRLRPARGEDLELLEDE